MQKLRRWAAAALCGAAFAGSAAAVLTACAVCPGRAWIVRGGAVFAGPRGGCGHRLASGCRPGRLQAPKPDRRPRPCRGDLPWPRQLRQRPRRSRPPFTPLPSAAPGLDDAGRIRSVTLRQGSGDG